MANRVSKAAVLGCGRAGQIHAAHREMRIPDALEVENVTSVTSAKPRHFAAERDLEACRVSLCASIDAGWQTHTSPVPGWAAYDFCAQGDR